jgi:hypothetical protein
MKTQQYFSSVNTTSVEVAMFCEEHRKLRISVKALKRVTPRDRPTGKPVTTTKEHLSEMMA